jgi:hypothetical protein
MPNSSERAQALARLETQLTTLAENICDAWIVLRDAIEGETPLGVQEYLELLHTYEQLASQRYSVPRVYGFVGGGAQGGGRYGVHVIDDLLHRFPETPFRAMWRLEFEEFQELADLLIEAAPTETFWGPVPGNPTGGRPARPPIEQIAIALYVLGGSGGSRERDRIALNIGKGSTYNYTNKLIKLLIHLLPEYIVWPSAAERRARMHEQHSIFRRAVGFVDGCEIPLAWEPKNHHETYYSRHSQYGFQMQVVCDWNARIRYVYTGNQASVQDSTALRTTELWRQRDRYFTDEEYLLGDKGYFTDKNLVIPYKKPAADRLEGAEKFNQEIASVCTQVIQYKYSKLI